MSELDTLKSSPPPRKGRGALSAPVSRFDAYTREACDDGWDSDEQPAPLSTVLIPDSARSIISRNDSPDVPFRQSLNAYRGCEHGCIYCYARPSHAYYGFSPGLEFETRIVYKPHAAGLLAEALRKPGYQCEPLAISTNTDAYQPVERQLCLTRRMLEVLQQYQHPCSLVTKAVLIERDLDILAAMAAHKLARVNFSLPTLNRALSRALEPRAAAPQRRLQAIQRFSTAGIPTGVLFAPVIPGLNDTELETVLNAAREAGAGFAAYVMLRLPREVEALFTEWLEAHHPLKAAKVMNRVREVHGGKAYDSRFGHRMQGSGIYAQLIAQRFQQACKRLGFNTVRRELDCSRFKVPVQAGDQLAIHLSRDK